MKNSLMNSDIYNLPDSKSMWMLIVNGYPAFKCEFPYIINDKDVAEYHGNAESLLVKLKHKNG